MSAYPRPAVSPEIAPNLQALPPKRLTPLSRWAAAALCILLLACAVFWRVRAARETRRAAERVVRTVRAVQGRIQSTRRLTGTVAARRYAMVAAPVLQAPDTGRGLVLTYLAESGTHVNEGAVVARIDNQKIIDHLDDVQDMLSQASVELRRKQIENVAEMEELQQSVRAARAEWQKAELDARTVSVKPAITAELLKLSALQTRAMYEGLAEQVAMVRERQRSDVRIRELAYERQVRHLKRHQTDAVRCEIKAPISGTVVLQTLRRHGEMNQVKLGDELSPGQPFLRVVDSSDMLLDATMAQSEAGLFRIGQRARVRFDAFPEITLPARIEALGAIAVSGRRTNYFVRTVPLRLAIEAGDPRLIPDLTASADVVIGEGGEGLIVPREALLERAGKAVVYVREAETFAPREVAVAGQNSTHAAIASGLTEGAEVVLDPRGM
jgi:HlyD family secretion protein